MSNRSETNGTAVVTAAAASAELAEMCPIYHSYFEQISYAFYKTPATGVLVTSLYVAVLTLGAIGNLLVITAVVRNPAMRSPRNFFIVNLALSDFLLCTVTVPFNMKLVLFLFWGLGQVACKMVATAQGVNIFVSTMSITAVGLDRYLVIIFPTKKFHQRFVTGATFVCVWSLSILFASPYFFVTSVENAFAGNPEIYTGLRACNLSDQYVTCHEDGLLWLRMPLGRNAYTIACFVFQYLLPLCALTFVYCHIGSRMRARLHGPARAANEDRRRSVQNRQRRTNILLISLVLIFAVSWLPLNIYNTLTVFELVNYNLTTFTFCHIAGMMSACANPVLYGVLNDNFRVEFEQIFEQLHILPCLRGAKRLLCSCHPCLQRLSIEDQTTKTVTTPARRANMHTLEMAEKQPLCNGATLPQSDNLNDASDDVLL